MDDRDSDPICPRCGSVSAVVAATATYHQWDCQRCNLLFSTTLDFAATAPAWARHARRRWLEGHQQPTPAPTDTGEALAARARHIAQKGAAR